MANPAFKIRTNSFSNLAKTLARKRTLLTHVEKAAALSATQVQGEAIKTLQRGPPRSGRIYTKGGKTAQRSAPGEPLKSDTGHLASHIFARLGRGYAEVGTTVGYGKYWEEDAPQRARRPWLRPAYEKHYDAIVARMARATKRAMGG